MSGPAEAAALASLDAQDQLDKRVMTLVERRERLVRELRALGLNVPDAQGNFVWIPESSSNLPTEALAAAFAERGTLVRPFKGQGLRISIGEAESIDEVLNVVKGEMA